MDLVYGSALWYASTKVNCHHFAERLAQERQVLFIESVGARVPAAREWRRVLPRLLRSLRPLRRLGPRLWLFSPLPLPLYRGVGVELSSRWVGWQVKVLLRLRGWREEACWVFHPMGFGTARAGRPHGVIYYCVDDQAANPGIDRVAVRRLEAALLQVADAVIATGEPLAARLRPLARTVRVLPNVADTELFARHASTFKHPVLDFLDGLPRPRIGYIGNLAAYKIDLDLVHQIARRRPDWAVVLVGPLNQGDPKSTIRESDAPSNVHFTSAVPHEIAPAVIDRFEVCLIPSAQHDVMAASFPLKFFEYLLRGRPIVCRPLPSLQPFRAWYDEAVTTEEFVDAIERRLALDSPAEADRRRAYASAFGWSERMQRLRALRGEVIRSRASQSLNPIPS